MLVPPKVHNPQAPLPKPTYLWGLFAYLVLGIAITLGLTLFALSAGPTEPLFAEWVPAPFREMAALVQEPLQGMAENVAQVAASDVAAAPLEAPLPESALLTNPASGGGGGGLDPVVVGQGGTCIFGSVIDIYEQPRGEGWKVTIQKIAPTTESLQPETVRATGEFGPKSALTAGTYKVILTYPEGWREVTAASFEVTLSGQPGDTKCAEVRFKLEALANLEIVKLDKGGNLGFPGKVGIPGWIIYLKDPITGADLMTGITDGEGKVYFRNIPPGKWNVVEETKIGWTPSDGYPGVVQVTLVSPVNPGAFEYVTFVNEQVNEATIVIKKTDPFGNGVPDWCFTISRPDGTHADRRACTPLNSGITYVSHLAPGEWKVTEDTNVWWRPITPVSQKVTLDPGEVEWVSFVNEALGCIDGYKINHLEDGLSGWTINARDTDSQLHSTTTDANGYFQMIVTLGKWTVEETMQEGWTAVTPSMFDVEVTQPFTCEHVRFKNRTNVACVDVYKKDTYGDVGIPNWLINVKPAFGGNLLSGVTDGTGWVRFNNLPPGTYKIWEGSQPGWVAVGATEYQVDLEATGECEVYTFYNRQTNNPGPLARPEPPTKAVNDSNHGCSAYYTVKPGDTLYRIATSYGTTWPALQAANNLANAGLIYSGLQLCIP